MWNGCAFHGTHEFSAINIYAAETASWKRPNYLTTQTDTNMWKVASNSCSTSKLRQRLLLLLLLLRCCCCVVAHVCMPFSFIRPRVSSALNLYSTHTVITTARAATHATYSWKNNNFLESRQTICICQLRNCCKIRKYDENSKFSS